MSTHRPLSRVLGHPLWIASLALLIANDHLLKGSGLLPGWLTGKLSDIAGMLVAPALLALLLALVLRVGRERANAVAHVAVGAGFAALEVSPALSARLDAAYQLVGMRWVATSDWTDLLVLALLPFSYVFVQRISAAPGAAGLGAPSRRRPIELALATAGLAASIATSDTEPAPECDFDCDFDGYGVPEDCNDFDSTISPGNGNCPGSAREEACDNGVDDNGDSLVDCVDPLCASACADTQLACDAALPLTIAEDGLLYGSTLTGSWALEGSCGGADAPETVFSFGSYGGVAGVLIIDVPEGHVVYARRQCGVAQDETDCVSSELVEGDDEADTSLLVEMAQGEQITVVFDALDGLAASDFATPVRFVPLGCGDETIDVYIGEQCDDGNLENGDGCSDLCQSEAWQVCEEAELLTLAEPIITNFTDASLFFSSVCSEGSGAEQAPERAFVYTATSAGVLTVTASMVGSALSVFAQNECRGASIACAPYGAAGEATDLALPLAAGATVHVFIEGTPDTPLDAELSVSGAFVAD